MGVGLTPGRISIFPELKFTSEQIDSSIIDGNIEDVSQTLIKTHKELPVHIFLITYYKRVQNMSLFQHHTC